MTNPYYVEKWGSKDIKGYGDSTAGDFRYEDPQTKKSGTSAQDISQGVASGLAAGAAHSENPDEFSVDPNAGFWASNGGLSSGGGGAGGVISAITGGVSAQMGQFSNVNKKLGKLDTNVQGVTYDAYGRPTYNSSAILDARSTVDSLNRGYDSMTKNLFQGGEGFDPATRGFAAVYGTPGKIRRKRRQLQASIANSQEDYNKADVNFRNTQNQQQDYYRRQNPYGRMYNIYRSQNA